MAEVGKALLTFDSCCCQDDLGGTELCSSITTQATSIAEMELSRYIGGGLLVPRHTCVAAFVLFLTKSYYVALGCLELTM